MDRQLSIIQITSETSRTGNNFDRGFKINVLSVHGAISQTGGIRRVSGGGLYLSALVHTSLLPSGIKYSRVVWEPPSFHETSQDLSNVSNAHVNGTLGVNLELVRQSHIHHTRESMCAVEWECVLGGDHWILDGVLDPWDPCQDGP